MVPPIERQEWRDLITGKLKPVISSFSLQMKLNTLVTAYSNKNIPMDKAVKELHEMCLKYNKIYKNDLDKIFK
jgi:hypothetical protein